MALITKFDTHDTAYVKIMEVTTNFHVNIADVMIFIFSDKQSRLDGFDPIYIKRFRTDDVFESKEEKFNLYFNIDEAINGINHVQQAYTYLKTLDIFKNAIDDI